MSNLNQYGLKTKLEDIELVSKQIYLENIFNKKQKRKIMFEALKELLEPIQDEVFRSDFTEEETKEYFTTMDNLAEILYILAERESITVNTLIPMLLERNDYNIVPEQVIDFIGIGNYYELWRLSKDRYTRLHSNYSLDDETMAQIKRFRFLNPMIVSPLEVNAKGNNRGSGYLTIGSDSLILGGIHHTKEICTNVLDKLNSTQFSYNLDLIYAYRNSWSSMNEPKKADGIDRMQDETKAEYDKRIQAFEQYEKLVYETASQIVSSGNVCYLTHKYDKRGRVYCIGYQCSYQNNSYGKAVLDFANKELVSDTINFFD